jgi:hypothetical protein
MAITFVAGALGVGIAGIAVSKAMNAGIDNLMTRTQQMSDSWMKTVSKITLFSLTLISLMVFFFLGIGGFSVAFSSLIIATGLPVEIAWLALIITGVAFREELFCASAIVCDWVGVYKVSPERL